MSRANGSDPRPTLPPFEEREAISALSALAQETRLAAFRLLIQTGPEGMSAGHIGAALDVAPSTLSFHLSHLERANLVHSWRVQRQIFYAADIGGVRRLLLFLTENCCDSRPEICSDLFKSTQTAVSNLDSGYH